MFEDDSKFGNLPERSEGESDLSHLVRYSTAAMLSFDFIALNAAPSDRLHISRKSLLEFNSRCTTLNAAASKALPLFGIKSLSIGDPFSKAYNNESHFPEIFDEWFKRDCTSDSFELTVKKESARIPLIRIQAIIYARKSSDSNHRIWMIMRDITEQAHARQTLEAAEEYYRSTLQLAGLIFVRVNQKGETTFLSEGIQKLLGKLPALGLPLQDLLSERLHPNDLDLRLRFKRIFEEGRDDDFDIALLSLDRTYTWYHIRFVSKRDGRGILEHIDVIALDIDRHKRVELEMARMQRVELIGEVAAGVAHDFNNQLSIIAAHLEVLKPAVIAAGPQAEAYLQGAVEAVQGSADMTHSMLEIANGGNTHRSILDLREAATKSVALLRHVIPSKIDLKVQTEDRPVFINGEKTEIHQVIMNLVLNARDAMPHSGKIEVSVRFLSDAKRVELCVQDSGAGIPENQLERIFDPFFTTKAKTSQSGSGLGLAMVASIIRNHQGGVKVKSSVGVGTAFHIWFPAASIEKIEQKKLSNVSSCAGDLFPMHVLVADDNDPVRTLLVQTLTLHGFSVISARDGREALDLFELHKDTLNAVVLDETMPQFSGAEVASRIHSHNPKLRIVVTSGYLKRSMKDLERNPGFLGKPFSIDELVGALRR